MAQLLFSSYTLKDQEQYDKLLRKAMFHAKLLDVYSPNARVWLKAMYPFLGHNTPEDFCIATGLSDHFHYLNKEYCTENLSKPSLSSICLGKGVPPHITMMLFNDTDHPLRISNKSDIALLSTIAANLYDQPLDIRRQVVEDVKIRI